eukprot:5347696-Pyramimonas_sp.AAC.1
MSIGIPTSYRYRNSSYQLLLSRERGETCLQSTPKESSTYQVGGAGADVGLFICPARGRRNAAANINNQSETRDCQHLTFQRASLIRRDELPSFSVTSNEIVILADLLQPRIPTKCLRYSDELSSIGLNATYVQ